MEPEHHRNTASTSAATHTDDVEMFLEAKAHKESSMIAPGSATEAEG